MAIIEHVEVVVGDNIGTNVEGGRGEDRVGEQLLQFRLVLENAVERHAIVPVKLGEIAGQTTCA
jgi:hypothetical protein